MTKPILRCTKCHSTDIRQNADVAQDSETGEWEVVSFFDSFTCEECEGECSVEEAPILNYSQKEIKRVLDRCKSEQVNPTIKITGCSLHSNCIDMTHKQADKLIEIMAD